ncbi:IS1096 element passenger TnpR family protein [Humibacter sp.]|uniref:IS1096 element passenger TnpR family protein n=1 Tax=Humibacter sp. TaxID=1940291 RepID=UPI003F7CED6F
MRRLPDDNALLLRVTLRGSAPEVERTLAMGAGLTFADLHTAIQLVFEGDRAAHHVFCDLDPFPQGFPDTAGNFYDDCSWYYRRDHYGWEPRRLWGDIWTTIDWRDPGVIDERSTPLSSVFRQERDLHYRCEDPLAVAESAWFQIHCMGTESALSPSGLVRVVDGRQRGPFKLFAAAEYAAQLAAFLDADSDDHDAAALALNRACGPWASFDPTEVPFQRLQARLDERWGVERNHRSPRKVTRTALDDLVRALPSSNAIGLQRHLDDLSLRSTPDVGEDDAARFVRPFVWLVDRCREGIPFPDRQLPAGVGREWADAVQCDESHVPELLAAARTFRLVRPLQGRLISLKSPLRLIEDPLGLWEHLARSLLGGNGRASALSNVLFVLAMADGSISVGGSDGGISRLAYAHAVLEDSMATRYWGRYPRRWQGGPTPISIEATRRLVAPLAAQLAPLGLTPTSEDTWQVAPLLRSFARWALTAPTSVYAPLLAATSPADRSTLSARAG